MAHELPPDTGLAPVFGIYIITFSHHMFYRTKCGCIWVLYKNRGCGHTSQIIAFHVFG
jgi:hypothetical protein